MQVAALILAAGTSSRAGAQNKLLFQYKGQPLLKHLVDAVQASAASRCLAVTGHERAEVEAVLASCQVPSVYNANYASGMASSLVAGVSALADADALLVCLGDMPHIDAATIDSMVASAHSHPGKWLLAPCYQGCRGHPVLIRQPLFARMRLLVGDKGAKVLFSEFPDTVLEVAVDTPAILADYDTQAALASLAPAPDPATGTVSAARRNNETDS